VGRLAEVHVPVAEAPVAQRVLEAARGRQFAPQARTLTSVDGKELQFEPQARTLTSVDGKELQFEPQARMLTSVGGKELMFAPPARTSMWTEAALG
jgi:hypothetical protein